MGDISIDEAVKNFKLIDDKKISARREISCECEYPCYTNLCPKVKNPNVYPMGMCHVNSCDVVNEYSKLTHNKNFCSKCGRKLR